MKILDKTTGQWKTIPIGGTTIDYDNLPVGSIIDYDGDTVPAGYEQTEDETEGGTWIGSDTPTSAYNLWINPDEDISSATEVVNSLEGKELDKAPSVNIINDALDGKADNDDIPTVNTSSSVSTSDTYSCKYINDKISDIENKQIFALYQYSGSSSTEWPSSSCLPMTTKIYDNSNNVFVMDGNGLITINHTGYIKLSLNLWLYSGYTDMRPWVLIQRYPSGNTIADYITSNSSYYQSIAIPELIFSVTSGEQICIKVSADASRTFRVNAGSGRNNSSYVTMQIIE